MHFNHGDPVFLRYVSPDPGREFDRVQVARVVEDSAERTVLYVAAGSEYRQPAETRKPGSTERNSGGFVTSAWRNWSIIRLMYSGVPYSIWAMYSAESHMFTRWYVNIERPFQRWRRGFDVVDHELDVVVQPDRSWAWKDEDHLQRMVTEGLFTGEQANEFYTHGRDAISRVERVEAPFSEPWPEWRPPTNWEPLRMPADDSEWQN